MPDFECDAPVNISELRDQLPTDHVMQELARFFKVFGEVSRIRILAALYLRELCVCDLVDLLGTSQPAVSHQLRVLRSTRVVKARKEGKHVYYSLDDDHVRELLRDGLEHIQGNCR
ncbi:MAG: transcriptional regulator [Desulfobacterales bacterium]|nr:MAG: transcriptional regulator [Desulfobacterales bacterium]